MLKQIKNFIPFLVVLLCCTSCKKDKADTDVSVGTISATIDGTATTFNFRAKATGSNVSGGYGISIQGFKKDPSASQTSLSISIARGTQITSGTYVENSGSNPLVEMTYNYDLVFGIVYTSTTYGSATKPVTITITDINSTSVKGTFSCELLGNDVNGNPAKTVFTDGVFYVSF